MLIGGLLVLSGALGGAVGGVAFATFALTRRDEVQGAIVKEIVADILAVMESINSKPIDVDGANERVRVMRERLRTFERLMGALKP